MATRTDMTQLAATEDALTASLDAIGLAPVEVLQRIALADQRQLEGRLVDPRAMPPAADALAALRDLIEAEDRRDYQRAIATLDMLPDGRLHDADGLAREKMPTLGLSQHALCQLAQRLPYRPAHAGPYWSTVPARRRAVEFNEVVTDNVRRDAGLYQITLRTRTARGAAAPYIFAAVSDRFVAYDRLAADVLEALGEDAETVRAEVYYTGLTTDIRLLLTEQGGFGVLARCSTADDGTASVGIGAELLLPSGATYLGRTGTGARYRHVGEVAVEQIKASLDKVAAVIAPWVELWRRAADEQLPVAIEQAIDMLTGNVEEGTQRAARLRINGVPALELADDLKLVFRRAVDGKLAPFKPTQTQAGLAELLLVAARLTTDKARAEAYQALGQSLVELPIATLRRWLEAPRDRKDDPRWSLAEDNQTLADRVGALAQQAAGQWERRAAEAKDAGDVEGERVARERAELHLVEGDLLQQHPDLATPAETDAAPEIKPFEF